MSQRGENDECVTDMNINNKLDAGKLRPGSTIDQETIEASGTKSFI